MTDPWDGRPENPEWDGWHWVHWAEYGADMCFVAQWSQGRWIAPSEHLNTMHASYRYLGPCLTPSEIAAREADAYQRGQEAMPRHSDDMNDAVAAGIAADMAAGRCWACRRETGQPHAPGCIENVRAPR